MNALLTIAGKEIRDGLRNRWIVATTLLLAALALALSLLGSAPVGAVKANSLAVVVVSLSSLTIFLLPLIALLLAYDAIVGESERGTMALLLAYPVARWQVVIGKFIGHVAILAIATVLGYGAAGVAALSFGEVDPATWRALATMIATSILLGGAFLSIGYLASAGVRDRATAAGIAIGVWLLFVLIYDLGLLGLLVADQGRTITPGTLDWLLLLNPADVYRLLNLGGASVATFSGMAGLANDARLAPAMLVASLAAWVVVPLGAAVAIFARREI